MLILLFMFSFIILISHWKDYLCKKEFPVLANLLSNKKMMKRVQNGISSFFIRMNRSSHIFCWNHTSIVKYHLLFLSTYFYSCNLVLLSCQVQFKLIRSSIILSLILSIINIFISLVVLSISIWCDLYCNQEEVIFLKTN